MQPVEFKGQNIIFAKDQPQYQPLPAIKLEDGMVITCWEMTPEELEEVTQTRRVFLRQLTFNNLLQPVRITADLVDLMPEIENEGQRQYLGDSFHSFVHTASMSASVFEELRRLLRIRADASAKIISLGNTSFQSGQYRSLIDTCNNQIRAILHL
jgi:hypothetical protein